MKKLALLLISSFLACHSLFAEDLLQSSENWTTASNVTITDGKITSTAGWSVTHAAVYTFQQPIDLSHIGSSISLTYTIADFPTTTNNKNALATVTLISEKNNALITGWGDYDKSTGIQAGVTTTPNAQQSFRIDDASDSTKQSHGTHTDALTGINLTNPFTDDAAKVTVTLTCTATSEWQLTMSCNEQTQSVTLGGNQQENQALNCDFNQITNLTVSLAGRYKDSNHNVPSITTLTVNYSAPEPSCPVLIAITSLLAFRRKPNR